MKSDDFERFLTKLDSSSNSGEHDNDAVKEEATDFVDENGWNVFHYAAHNQSEFIMERLVEYLKGTI